MLFPDNELVHVVELSANIWMATRARLESRLKPLSMTWPQFGVLLALAERDGLSQRELGELLESDRQTVSVICDSLEKHGWAERRRDPADRRTNRVCLTGEGRSVTEQAQSIVWGAYAAIGSTLTAAEVQTVVPKLERLYAAIKEVPGGGAACCDESEG